MSRLYRWVESKDFSYERTVGIFLFLNCLLFGAFGFAAWAIVSRFVLNTLGWALCFIGYSGFFIGFVGGYIYLCRQ